MRRNCLSKICFVISGVIMLTFSSVAYADTNSSYNLTINDAKETLKIALGINSLKTNIQNNNDGVNKKYDVNNDGKVDLKDAKEVLKLALGINILTPNTTTDDVNASEKLKYTDEIVSITTDSDGIQELRFKDSFLYVTNDIKIMKDGTEVSSDELKAGMVITFDCSSILEIFPARIVGCTTIIIK